MKFNFKCTMCGNCCKQDGYVLLEKGEPERIAAYIDTTPKELSRYSVQAVDELNGHAIIIRDGKGCPFLKDNLCSIQDVKPKQCSDFPFWPEVYSSQEARDDIQSYCPGFEVIR